MGYRSEVAYRIVVKDKAVLNEVIAKVMMLGGYICKALKECEIEVESDNSKECYINFYAEDVKWYESYEDVKGHHALMENIVEWYPDDSAWYYLRVGEEPNDIDESHDGSDDWLDYVWDGMCAVTRLELPFSYNEGIGDNLRIFDDGVKA